MADRPLALLFAALLGFLGAPRLASAAPPQSARQDPAGVFSWDAPPELESAARRLVPEVEGVLVEARQWLRLPPGSRPFRVEFVGPKEDLSRALGRDLPSWFAAVALPQERRLVVATQAARSLPRLRATLRHEILHLAMGEIGPAASGRLPGWFHEGCAEVFAGEAYLGEQDVSLAWRAWIGDLEPLSAFESGFGRVPYRAAVGYALGEAFVERLIREYGSAVIPRLVQEVAGGSSFDAALIAETGLSVVTHEERLRKELASPVALLRDFYPQLFLGMMLLLLGTVPFVMARRRRRRRDLETRWEREDRAERGGAAGSGQWQEPMEDEVPGEAEALEGWVEDES